MSSLQKYPSVSAPPYMGHSRQSLGTSSATLEELMECVRELERNDAKRSRSRLVSQKIAPLVTFIERYGKAIDVFIQGADGALTIPISLAWGLLRMVLVSSAAFSQYFPKMLDMIERLGVTVSIYQDYEVLFNKDNRFVNALSQVYNQVTILLHKSQKVFQKRGSRFLIRFLWASFESDFQNELDDLARLLSTLDQETTLVHRKDVHGALTRIETLASKERCNSIMSTDARKSIMEWLAPLDSESYYIRTLRQRVHGTGDWLLRAPTFQDWASARVSPVLWIKGDPGTGKTTISTTVIEYLRATKRPVAFFFCDRLEGRKRDAITLFKTLMAQICSQSAEVPLALSEAYELGKTYGRRRLSISDSPTNLIECVLDETTGLHIIIDGLDELEDATEVFKFVRYCSHPGSRVRILILSRDLQRIRTDMSPFPTITLDVEQMKDDVRAFVSEAATRLPVQDPVFRESIISRVSQKADGKFLWSRWVMESLVNSVSLPHLMALLDEVPQGLSAVYADYLAELAKKDQHVQDLGVTLLQWVCCSKRTLSGEELQFAVAKHDEHTQGKGTPVVPFLPVLVELGHPLVIYQHDQDRFRLQHLSVREFLLDSNRRDALPPALHKFLVDEGVASRKLADKCLSCLSETPNPHTKKPPPLTPYAVRYWCEHVVQAPWASDLQAAVQQFLQDEERRRSWLADLLLQDGRGFSLQSMLRLQKQLTDWMVTNTTNTTGATNTQPNGLPSDWADDTLAILLQVDEGKFGKIEPPLSYFEKLMVIRDLARMLKQADRVQAGIARLEACLHSPKPNVGIEQVWIMNALGILYSQCEETGHSIVLHNRALIMQEATLGPSNMETMWTINELGRMHRHLGDFAGATARHQQALTVLKSILPSDHLEIVWTECTLARALRKQDKHKEALVLHQRAHDVYSRVLGHEHAHTLWTLGDIAQCLRSLGRLEESEEYHRRALKGRSKALGPEHPDTLWTINDLGVVLDERGNLEEALTLQQQALKAQERVLGSEHPHTKWTRNILDELKERQAIKIACAA